MSLPSGLLFQVVSLDNDNSMISLRINIKTYRQFFIVLLLVKMVSLYLIGLSFLLSLGYNGVTALEPRFVGSTIASISDYPYQLSIYYGKNDVCGATIIAPRWAITSAYCLNYKLPSKVLLRAGSNETQSGGTVYQVSNFYIHPKYNATTKDYNVALLNLTRPFVYGRNVKPVPLIAANRIVPTGANGVITGWGYVSNSGPAFSSTLRKLILSILDPYTCRGFYPKIYNLNTMICTQHVLHQKDLCANSGFPIVVNGSLVGISSTGSGCTSAPTIFIKLSAPTVRSWISSIARI